jgi:hypothetical protein
VAAVADKLATQAGWTRAGTHLLANLAIFLITGAALAQHARSVRRREQSRQVPEAARVG